MALGDEYCTHDVLFSPGSQVCSHHTRSQEQEATVEERSERGHLSSDKKLCHKREKDSRTWTTVWSSRVEGLGDGIRGLNGNGKRCNKNCFFKKSSATS